MAQRNGNNGKARAEAERGRLLAALRRGPLDRATASSVHAIPDVPHRVAQLRAEGYRITTVMVWAVTRDGKRYKVARYSLEGA